MERNVYDVLEERGFLKQCSHPEELRDLLGREKVTFYIGFDRRQTVCTSATMWR